MHEIIVSKNAGFCMGVKKAFAGANDAAKKYKNICIYGEMVHNKTALDSLYKKNIVLKKEISGIITDSSIENVIIRAHGISLEEEETLKKSGKNIFDFTCPKVKQVQLLAREYSEKGYSIILFGKKDHPEVIGIAGYCKTPYFIIKDMNEAEFLPFSDIVKPVLISQTTMNSFVFDRICAYLSNKLPELKIINTLCNSPIQIQENAVNLSGEVDAMLVVGDKMSANSTALFEKIKDKKPSWFIESISEIDLDKMKNYRRIGITGGSSTPITLIEDIKKYLENKLTD